MKPFVFSLERMRNFKQQNLDKEKNTLRRLQAQKNEIKQKIADLKNYREIKDKEYKEKQSKGVTSSEMMAFNFYMENTRMQIKALVIELEKVQQVIEKQLKVVIEASKEVSELDKLEEKQLEEYKYQEAKETEIEILETVTTKLSNKNESKLI